MSEQALKNAITVAGPKQTVHIGYGQPLAFILGPCVIESREHLLRHAEAISAIAQRLQIPVIFKSSYDKANRTSISSFRGLGIEEGLKLLAEVRREIGLPVLTDVHSPEQALQAGEVVDVIQIPAFLCRQTELLVAAAQTKKAVLIKKGQFVAPQDISFATQKVVESGNVNVMLCERGSCFGYRDLVVDFRGLDIMSANGTPVVFDATHSVQQMGGASGKSGGDRRYVSSLARAAVAVGVDAVFLECHETPDVAPSDGPNMLPLAQLEELLLDLIALSNLGLKTSRRS